jgi:ABC-2 type transport system permease protein
MLIRTGKFLTFMLRPLPHWFFAFSQKVGHRILGVGLEFVPVYIIFFFVFRIKLLPAYPIWCLISLMLSFMMMFFINYTVGIIGFWIVRTQGVRRMFLILRDIFAGVFIPLSFFPEVFQKILFFLPFQFITYVPVRVFIGTYELAGISLSIPQIVFIQAIEVFAMWLILLMAWNLGIKKFSGVGA